MPSKYWPMMVNLVAVYSIVEGTMLSKRGNDGGSTRNLEVASATLRMGKEQLPIYTKTLDGDVINAPITGMEILNTWTEGATEGWKSILEASDILTSLMYKHKVS
jgi:hypothetical protein